VPEGNAELTGQIAPGDQLAAINGKSSIGMKVDDICQAITDPKIKADTIKLTFLRYVGPYLPLPVDVESLKELDYEDDESIYTHTADGAGNLAQEEKSRGTSSTANANDPKGRKPAKPGKKKFAKWFKIGKSRKSTRSE